MQLYTQSLKHDWKPHGSSFLEDNTGAMESDASYINFLPEVKSIDASDST